MKKTNPDLLCLTEQQQKNLNSICLIETNLYLEEKSLF